MDNIKMVYSTESGRICPDCGQTITTCTCTKNKQQQAYPNDGIVRIKREVKGRGGKTITSIFGVPLDNDKLKKFAKTLKQRCGTGGSVKDGVIIIQGDHRNILMEEIKKHGYAVKLAGG